MKVCNVVLEASQLKNNRKECKGETQRMQIKFCDLCETLASLAIELF